MRISDIPPADRPNVANVTECGTANSSSDASFGPPISELAQPQAEDHGFPYFDHRNRILWDTSAQAR